MSRLPGPITVHRSIAAALLAAVTTTALVLAPGAFSSDPTGPDVPPKIPTNTASARPAQPRGSNVPTTTAPEIGPPAVTLLGRG